MSTVDATGDIRFLKSKRNWYLLNEKMKKDPDYLIQKSNKRIARIKQDIDDIKPLGLLEALSILTLGICLGEIIMSGSYKIWQNLPIWGLSAGTLLVILLAAVQITMSSNYSFVEIRAANWITSGVMLVLCFVFFLSTLAMLSPWSDLRYFSIDGEIREISGMTFRKPFANIEYLESVNRDYKIKITEIDRGIEKVIKADYFLKPWSKENNYPQLIMLIGEDAVLKDLENHTKDAFRLMSADEAIAYLLEKYSPFFEIDIQVSYSGKK